MQKFTCRAIETVLTHPALTHRQSLLSKKNPLQNNDLKRTNHHMNIFNPASK